MTATQVDEYEGYPPDPDEEGPGTNIPQPRAQAVRGQARGKLAPQVMSKSKARKIKRSSSRIIAKQKQRQALEARKAGATYQTIAETVGYHDASSARRAVMRAFEQVIQEPAQELRTIQQERLNHMLLRLWGRIDQGDESAMRTALQIMDKMDRLNGTEEAQKIDVSQTVTGGVLVIEGNKDDYIAAMKRMVGIDSSGQNVQAGQMPMTDPTSLQDPKALPSPQEASVVGPLYPPGMGGTVTGKDSGHDHDASHDVVDAELVEEADEPNQEDVPPSQPTRRKFSFGVDPTVRR